MKISHLFTWLIAATLSTATPTKGSKNTTDPSNHQITPASSAQLDWLPIAIKEKGNGIIEVQVFNFMKDDIKVVKHLSFFNESPLQKLTLTKDGQEVQFEGMFMSFLRTFDESAFMTFPSNSFRVLEINLHETYDLSAGGEFKVSMSGKLPIGPAKSINTLNHVQYRSNELTIVVKKKARKAKDIPPMTDALSTASHSKRSTKATDPHNHPITTASLAEHFDWLSITIKEKANGTIEARVFNFMKDDVKGFAIGTFLDEFPVRKAIVTKDGWTVPFSGFDFMIDTSNLSESAFVTIPSNSFRLVEFNLHELFDLTEGGEFKVSMAGELPTGVGTRLAGSIPYRSNQLTIMVDGREAKKKKEALGSQHEDKGEKKTKEQVKKDRDWQCQTACLDRASLRQDHEVIDLPLD